MTPPPEAELTTEEAADVLNVSHAFVIKLAESGKLPCRLVGTHRRILLRDVLRYKSVQKERALAALQEMVDDAQEQGMYEK